MKRLKLKQRTHSAVWKMWQHVYVYTIEQCGCVVVCGAGDCSHYFRHNLIDSCFSARPRGRQGSTTLLTVQQCLNMATLNIMC